jgi:hypothetical protein
MGRVVDVGNSSGLKSAESEPRSASNDLQQRVFVKDQALRAGTEQKAREFTKAGAEIHSRA